MTRLLLCQDLPGPRSGPLQPEHYFAAADLGADVRLRGLIAFLFGCYSASPLQLDNFPPAPLRNPIERAPPERQRVRRPRRLKYRV